MTAFFAAAGQYLAAVGVLHALAKAMRSFSSALGWLICAFLCHDFSFFFSKNTGEKPVVIFPIKENTTSLCL
jgi:hypothetical protein